MSTSNSPSSQSPAILSQADLLRREVRAAWSTPPRLSVPAWADQYRHLAKGFGATSGKWDTAAFEISRGPMLAVTEPGVHQITAMTCTQLLKTELLLNIFGYFAHTDPCPILILQPKDDAAEQFSKERLQPNIAATPVLKKLLSPAKRSPEETLTYKPFPGGFGGLVGAGSPDNLARRPIRVYLADEVDKYPVTREGDPLDLVGERTAQFGLNWLGVQACSPTVEDESRIASCYADSDQRRASVACPHCEHRQFLDFFKHVEWQKDERGRHLPKTARICCEACGTAWSEGERLKALASIRWHQTAPFECCGARHVPLEAYAAAWRDAAKLAPVDQGWDWWSDAEEGRYAVYRAKCPSCGKWGVDNRHAGFQASKLFSPSQKDKPSDIADKWLKAKGNPDKELVWWNTQMGLPHRPVGGKVVALETLLARREVWPADVHPSVAVITVGIDVQDYRVEIEVVGWGADEESWSIDYHVIEGEFSEPATRDAVDAYLKKIWRRANGHGLEVMATCIDSGGHHTQHVYNFSKARLGRRVWAIKGASERDGQRNPVWPTKKPNRRQKATFRPVVIGGNAARDTIRARLGLEQPAPDAAAPGYMHFPTDRDVGYFEQLLADRLVLKEAAGRRYRVWETPAGRANEAADCRVYAYAALCGLLHFGLQLNRRAQAQRATPDEVAAPPAPELPRHEANLITPAAPAPPAAAKRNLVSRLA